MFKSLLALFKGTGSTQKAGSRSSSKSIVKPTSQGASSRIAELVKARKASNTPLMDIYVELNQLSKNSNDLALLEACSKATSRIEDTTVERNLRGKDYEKTGETQKAIRLYELNLADHFDGSHPYERLRILYKSLGKNADVVRVCNAFIEFGGNDPDLKKKYEKIISELSKYTASSQP